MKYIMRNNNFVQYIIKQTDEAERIIAYSNSGKDWITRIPVHMIYKSTNELRHYQRINRHWTSEQIEEFLFTELI